MKIPDGWVLVPREPTEAMIENGLRDSEGFNELGVADDKLARAYVGTLTAAPSPPADPEVEAGKLMDGYAGAVMRLIDRCDYREVAAWMTSEILRGTKQEDIILAAAAMVEATLLQCASKVTRSQMRQFAATIGTKAAQVLEQDIAAMIANKKSDTILHNRIRIVPPGA